MVVVVGFAVELPMLERPSHEARKRKRRGGEELIRGRGRVLVGMYVGRQ
jgi:hypothetical protein